jgi:hypothetical protein
LPRLRSSALLYVVYKEGTGVEHDMQMGIELTARKEACYDDQERKKREG